MTNPPGMIEAFFREFSRSFVTVSHPHRAIHLAISTSSPQLRGGSSVLMFLFLRIVPKALYAGRAPFSMARSGAVSNRN
ncbi:hypothetical protein BN77_p11651 [Rhizobium mesoamericanum STM3625]|uniref:Uncharacterized protein n=1 Tax=Rhizobium mesoamericanum STM3625 TaxID=1211777 RepID=K0PYB3_9HYPH|nr:hypothetical protein BN77_p11651 [Rhizobium mesoamericanum STM3625]